MECVVEFDYDAQETDEISIKKGETIVNIVQKIDGWWEGTVKGTNRRGLFPDNFVKVIEKPATPAIVPTPKAPPPEDVKVEKSTGPSKNVLLRNNSKKNTRRLKALFSYSPEQEDELRLEVGDIIEYLEEVEEGWYRGKKMSGTIGIFPSNFVNDVELPAPANGKIESDNKLNDLSKLPKAIIAVPDVVPPAPPTSEPPPMDDDDEPPPLLPPKPVREQARVFYPYKALNEDELTLVEGEIITIISKTCEDEGWWRGETKAGKSGLFPDNFVKIISSTEASNPGKTGNSSGTQGPKISPQERNLIGVKPIVNNSGSVERSNSSSSDKKSNGSMDAADGIINNKPKPQEPGEGHESVSSKVARFSQFNPNFNPAAKKPTTPTSPVSPFSLPPGAGMVSKSEENGNGGIDFNAVERGEKLSHLTAGRAKAPRRRPPSTVCAKDDENGLNDSYESSEYLDSPLNHSTPFNISMNGSNNSQYNTASNSVNSLLDESNASENNSVDSSNSVVKPKVVLPWMAELKQKQDKKQGLNSPTSSPNTSINSNNNTPVQKDKEISLPPNTKAPPLPAKPNSIDKGVVTITPPTTAPPSVTNRVLGKKSPAPGAPVQINHSHVYSGNEIGGGDLKHYVSYEEYAKLRDRVTILETELETVRRQVKLLLDRELNQGHIV